MFRQKDIDFIKKHVIESASKSLKTGQIRLFMDNETKKMFRTLGFVSTAGLAMAISIALGALIGYYLDQKFKTEPWLFIVFLVFGIVAAFKNLHLMYKKAKDISDQ